MDNRNPEYPNLVSFDKMTEEEKFAIRSKGGQVRGEQIREEKRLARILKAMLSSKTGIEGLEDLSNEDAMCLAMIKKSIGGSEKAFEVVRDTIGEKPTDKTEVSGVSTVLLKDDVDE